MCAKGMKRKIMKIANTTYVVSLPLKWAREHNIQKGDEIEVNEIKNGLTLTIDSLNKKNDESYYIDLQNLKKVSNRYVTALFRKGVNEIKFNYKTPQIYQLIKKCISEQTIGLEVVSQTKNHCVIKDLSGIHDEQFLNVLRRIWLLILEMSKDSLIFAIKKDVDSLKNMYYRDRDINKFANYCLRTLINDKTLNEYNRIIFFHFIRNLEEVGDNYKDFCAYFERNLYTLSEEEKNQFEVVNNLFNNFYKLFYSFSDDKLEKILIESGDIYKQIEILFQKNKVDRMTLHYLFSIVTCIKNLLSTVLELNLVKKS